MSRRNKPNDVFKKIDLNPQPPSTCWLWKGSINDKGLPYFHVHGKSIIAYRLVYWITHPTWDINNSREVIRHGCTDIYGNAVDNPLCCNPQHLSTGTQDENIMDMMVRGRRGLPKEAVRAIIDILEKQKNGTAEITLTHEQIGRVVGAKYGVPIARTTVTDISNMRRRKVMRDVLDAESKRIEESGDAKRNSEG